MACRRRRWSLACVLQGAILLLLAPRDVLAAAEAAAACRAGAGLACDDRGREFEVDEEALIQVRRDELGEPGLLDRLAAVAAGGSTVSEGGTGDGDANDTASEAVNSTVKNATDTLKSTISKANISEAVNSTVQNATDAINKAVGAANDTLNNAVSAMNGALDKLGKSLMPSTEANESDANESDANESDANESDSEPKNASNLSAKAAEAVAKATNIGEQLKAHAAQTEDALVDAIETAQVAEIKRAVYRSLERLKAAEFKEFDIMERLQLQAIDDYNDHHHYIAENPLEHIDTLDLDPSKDNLTSFHD